ncbi:hypothetical protein Taro_020471 [Colocasia esculenta]|uniref:Uncharacterized protein n=1 Tax=Colocasia esculenta TaxID=4460 RepID=A0A843V2G2_COLES|nr:hypothetical protein [Colocasia esculenta]
MDLKGLRGSGTVFDIESGITATEDPTGGVKQEKQLLNSVWSGFVNADRLVTGEEAGSIGNVLVSQVDMPTANGESLKNLGGEENVGVVWKIEDEKPKRKKKACRKAPKPPRPPRAPSLDASDQKLIREISELALLKRARIERMKALRKMKNAKASSSKSNFSWQNPSRGRASMVKVGGGLLAELSGEDNMGSICNSVPAKKLIFIPSNAYA